MVETMIMNDYEFLYKGMSEYFYNTAFPVSAYFYTNKSVSGSWQSITHVCKHHLT